MRLLACLLAALAFGTSAASLAAGPAPFRWLLAVLCGVMGVLWSVVAIFYDGGCDGRFDERR